MRAILCIALLATAFLRAETVEERVARFENRLGVYLDELEETDERFTQKGELYEVLRWWWSENGEKEKQKAWTDPQYNPFERARPELSKWRAANVELRSGQTILGRTHVLRDKNGIWVLAAGQKTFYEDSAVKKVTNVLWVTETLADKARRLETENEVLHEQIVKLRREAKDLAAAENAEAMKVLINTIAKLEDEAAMWRAKAAQTEEETPGYGEISPRTGKPKKTFVRAHWRSGEYDGYDY